MSDYTPEDCKQDVSDLVYEDFMDATPAKKAERILALVYAQASRLEALEAVCDQHGLLCKYDRLPCEHDHACIEVGPDCGCVRIGGRR